MYTPLPELARVAKAEHRIEECIQRGKSEAGLADYEVRTWVGWHHHQVLSLIAVWFLTREARREKTRPRPHRSPTPPSAGEAAAGSLWPVHSRADRTRSHAAPHAQRARANLSLEDP
jgi:hypothetical protein